MRRSSGGVIMHDPLAVAVAIAPGMVTTELLHVRVETDNSEKLGATILDKAAGAIDVATAVDADRVLDLFSGRVLS